MFLMHLFRWELCFVSKIIASTRIPIHQFFIRHTLNIGDFDKRRIIFFIYLSIYQQGFNILL